MFFLAFTAGFILGIAWVSSGIILRAARRCCRCQVRVWCWYLGCHADVHRCAACWAAAEQLVGAESGSEAGDGATG